MMASTHSQFEAAIFQALLPQLEAEGFEVFFHPSRQMLPAFLETCQPDAIALKGDKKLAIEIASNTKQVESKIERLQQIFAEHKDWELRVLYAPPRLPEENLSIVARSTIEEHLDRINAVADSIGSTAALLAAWSAFEATARSLIPNELGRPQQPARLLEVLASDGYVTPDEADLLRRLGRLRNEAAHGDLNIKLDAEDLEKFVFIIRTLLGLQDQGSSKLPA